MCPLTGSNSPLNDKTLSCSANYCQNNTAYTNAVATSMNGLGSPPALGETGKMKLYPWWKVRGHDSLSRNVPLHSSGVSGNGTNTKSLRHSYTCVHKPPHLPITHHPARASFPSIRSLRWVSWPHAESLLSSEVLWGLSHMTPSSSSLWNDNFYPFILLLVIQHCGSRGPQSHIRLASTLPTSWPSS